MAEHHSSHSFMVSCLCAALTMVSVGCGASTVSDGGSSADVSILGDASMGVLDAGNDDARYENDASVGDGSADHGDASSEGAGSTTLMVGFMVHLEGRTFPNATVLDGFATEIRGYADVFARHGARLTLEAKECVQASNQFHNDFLVRLNSQGHHVAIHADLGGRPNPSYTLDRMIADLRTRRTELDMLGISYRHVSGVCANIDWPRAVRETGFEFVSGVVAYCLQSLPAEQRPPEYRDCIDAAHCHDPWPLTFAERLHPWRVRIGTSWTDWRVDDPSGEIVIMPTVRSFNCAEGTEGTSCDPALSASDIDDDVAAIEQALTMVDPNRVNAFVFSWSIGARQDPAMLDAFLSRLDGLVASGRVRFATLPEMYDAFVAWERAVGRR